MYVYARDYFLQQYYGIGINSTGFMPGIYDVAYR